jgi:hypothetical protein
LCACVYVAVSLSTLSSSRSASTSCCLLSDI